MTPEIFVVTQSGIPWRGYSQGDTALLTTTDSPTIRTLEGGMLGLTLNYGAVLFGNSRPVTRDASDRPELSGLVWKGNTSKIVGLFSNQTDALLANKELLAHEYGYFEPWDARYKEASFALLRQIGDHDHWIALEAELARQALGPENMMSEPVVPPAPKELRARRMGSNYPHAAICPACQFKNYVGRWGSSVRCGGCSEIITIYD